MELSDCSYFAGDSLLHPEVPYRPQGVSGVPASDSFAGGDIIIGALLLCMVMTALATSNSRHFIARQTKDLFHPVRPGYTDATETAPEVQMQLLIILGACLQISVAAYFITTSHYATDFRLPSPYWLIAIYTGLTTGYYLLRMLLYWAVNATFFGAHAAAAWTKTLLFLTSMEGVLTLPAVLTMACFNVSTKAATVYLLGVLALTRLMTLYKARTIFFGGFGRILQNILYFCTLEIVPLLALGATMAAMATYLRVII